MAFNAGPAPKVNKVYRGGYDDGGASGYADDWGRAQMRAGQNEQERLASIQSGEGSVAAQQMRAGLGQAQQAMAAQAGAGGSNPLAQRAAINAGAQMQQRGVTDAAALRAQEMAAARDSLANYYQRQAQGHMGYDHMNQQGQIAEEKLRRDHARHRTEQEAAQRNFAMQILGTAANAGSMLSDERAKMGVVAADPAAADATIRGLGGGAPVRVVDTSGMSRSQIDAIPGYEMRPKDADDDAVKRYAAHLQSSSADATLRGIKGHEYQYRPQHVAAGEPAGQRYGVMAQDLERTPLGASVVHNTPEGKRIDTDQATGMQLALTGRLGERQDATEEAVKRLAAQLEAEGAKTRRKLGR